MTIFTKENCKFHYLRGSDGRVLTVSTHKDGDMFSVSYCLCNPVDRFVKSEGREICIVRMNRKKGFTIVIPEDRQKHNVLPSVVKALSKFGNSRVRNVCKSWLKRNNAA